MTLQPPDEEVNTRTYSSPRRDQQAQETRQAILEAALELFSTQGFHQTTVKQVAERAVVSEQTVYNTFNDKIGLLWSAGMKFIEAGGDADEAVLLEALRAETNPHRRIRLVARDSREFWGESAEAILQLERLTLDPEVSDPRLEELAEKSLAHKRASTRAICEIIFPDAIRRPALSLDDIIDYLTAIDTAATITTLRNLGWSMEQWEAWVVQLLTSFIDPNMAENTSGHA